MHLVNAHPETSHHGVAAGGATGLVWNFQHGDGAQPGETQDLQRIYAIGAQ